MKKDYWLRNKKEGERQHDNSQEVKVVGTIVPDVLILSLDNMNDAWVVDSTASFHATPHKKYFQDYIQGDFGYVYLGNDKARKVVGKGKVHKATK